MCKDSKYKDMPYMLKIEWNPDTGKFIAYYPELPGCMAEGTGMMEARSKAEREKEKWIRDAIDRGEHIEDACYQEVYETSVRVGLSRERHDALSRAAKMRNMTLSEYCSRLLEGR